MKCPSEKGLFLWYIPKVVNELPEFKIVKVLKKYMEFTNGKNNIISSPGYMSIPSAKTNTIKKFCNKFSNIVPDEKSVYIGYLKGYGTGKILVSKPTSVKVIDEHYHYFSLVKPPKFKRLNINFSDKSDHRKMMFFFEKVEPSFNLGKFTLEKSSLLEFLDNITVNAVLIGSSNQSFNTYYAGGRGKADKGESDMLMFSYDKEHFSALTSDSNLSDTISVEGTTIFEGNYGAGINNPNDYLKDILKDFLKNALA